MEKTVGIFCPTLNVCGGGEFVAVAIANTLAQSNYKVILFTNSDVNAGAIETFFGETLNPTILAIKQPTNFTSRGLADFYQTMLYSLIARSKCDLFIDTFSNCVFPWTNISYIHFPFLNHHLFGTHFPYLSPHLLQAGTIPHVILEKNLADYEGKLILANSRYTAEEIRQYSRKSVPVLYPPFSPAIEEIGKNTIKNPQENLVVTVSRFEPNKLLERIPIIAAKTAQDIHFAVLGRLCNKQTFVSLRKMVEKLGLTHRITFYPDASAQTKIILLKRAKMYLHTMIGEHFGISIVEAMALGCLPIVHNSGGIIEFVPKQYRYETLVEAAEKITNEISVWSPDRAEKIKRVASQFSMRNFSSRFMDYFNSYTGGIDCQF